MKFKLEIDCDNAAFCPDEGLSSVGRARAAMAEVLRIIDGTRGLRTTGLRSGPLYDTNGNRVGHWSLDGD